MRVKNEIDRFHIVIDAITQLDCQEKEQIIADMNEKLQQHAKYIVENGQDLEEIRNWQF